VRNEPGDVHKEDSDSQDRPRAGFANRISRADFRINRSDDPLLPWHASPLLRASKEHSGPLVTAKTAASQLTPTHSSRFHKADKPLAFKHWGRGEKAALSRSARSPGPQLSQDPCLDPQGVQVEETKWGRSAPRDAELPPATRRPRSRCRSWHTPRGGQRCRDKNVAQTLRYQPNPSPLVAVDSCLAAHSRP
jgi:hypothetical protein